MDVGREGRVERLPTLQRQLPQQQPLPQAGLHQRPDQLIGLPERHAPGHQVVGHIGGIGVIAAHRLLQPSGTELQTLLEQDRHRLQAIQTGGHAVEQGLLVLLEILVVGQGQALDHREQSDQVAKHPAALTPHQFGHIGVLLLGHQAAAGGAAVGEGNKAEFLAGPEDHLLTEAAEVHHHQTGGGHEFHREIPVGHGIEAVGVNGVEPEGGGGMAAVDRHRRASQGGRPERRDVHATAHIGEALAIPLGHLDIGEQVVGQGQGLGPLQMGVAGHQGVGVGLGLGQQGALEAQQGPIDGIDPIPQPEAHIGAHLVIATAAGVQLLAQGTQQLDQAPLHGEVHVLGLDARLELTGGHLRTHLLEALLQADGLLKADHAADPEHAGMGDGAIEILLQQGNIETDRGIEPLDRRMEPLIEAVAPAGRRATGHTGTAAVSGARGGGGFSSHGEGTQADLSLPPGPRGDWISASAQPIDRGGSITSSRTLSTTIEASSSSWRSVPTKRSSRAKS